MLGLRGFTSVVHGLLIGRHTLSKKRRHPPSKIGAHNINMNNENNKSRAREAA